MALFEIGEKSITALDRVTFGTAGIYERRDLQRMLRENVEILSPNTMVLAEEFGEWEESKRRIDLLGLDIDARLVVIELKRTETGGHMELQAVRYAAMVSKMTFQQAVEAHRNFLNSIGQPGEEAEAKILAHLGWDEPSEELFANDVQIILASAEFSRELATAVLWLNEKGLDVRCVRMKPYTLDSRLLLDVQQVLPLPEAEDYQIKIREKTAQSRERREGGPDFTRFDLKIDGEEFTGLWKRGMMLRLMRTMVTKHSIAPDVLAQICPSHGRMWAVTEGLAQEEDEFITRANATSEKAGRRFDSRRYFTAAENLMFFDGRTYALSNQWGGGTWRSAIEKLREAYPSMSIEFEAASKV